MRTRVVTFGMAVLIAAVGMGFSTDRVQQEVPVVWHAQSGRTGQVANATATLVRTPEGIRYRFDTAGLTAGNAYTVWLVVINDPAECKVYPCAASTDIVPNPVTDSQVTFGQDGEVVDSTGTAVFRSRFRAGPLLDGWLPVQGIDDPMGAEIHLVVNDHGPLIEELTKEMTSTYRAGCTDASLPAFFPPAAFADGTPGPNTCRLSQAAVFPVPN